MVFYYRKDNLFESEGTGSERNCSKWHCFHASPFHLLYVTSQNSGTRTWTETPSQRLSFSYQVKRADQNLTLGFVQAADKEWIGVLNTGKWMFSQNAKRWFLTKDLRKWERSLSLISCSANPLWVQPEPNAISSSQFIWGSVRYTDSIIIQRSILCSWPNPERSDALLCRQRAILYSSLMIINFKSIRTIEILY